MNHRFLVLILPLLSACLFGACDSSNDVLPFRVLESVTFIDKGAVVPAPLCTIVTLHQESISFISCQNRDTIAAWSTVMTADDFFHLVSIVRVYNLVKTPDPVLPPGATGCVGHQGMVIEFAADGLLESLTIPGSLWCSRNRIYWPAGLESLVTFENDLVNKYKP